MILHTSHQYPNPSIDWEEEGGGKEAGKVRMIKLKIMYIMMFLTIIRKEVILLENRNKPRRIVINYVTMLVISDLSIFVYLSYHISCWPLLASTVSLISPLYKINEFNEIRRLTQMYIEPWILAKDREPVVWRER